MKKKRKRRAIIHVIAECHTCGKQFQDYLTARQKAREHARSTGHYVHGEVAYAFKYGKVR